MKNNQKKIGYIYGIFKEINPDTILFLQECRNQCDRLVIGIPSDNLVLRMTDAMPEQPFEVTKMLLSAMKAVDEVVSVDVDNISVVDSYKQIGYQVYFYGSEYGIRYQMDRQYLQSQGVELISLIPENIQKSEGRDPIREALKNTAAGKKIILFGTGIYFDYYMRQYGKEFMPVYAVDNSAKKWNTEKGSIPIYSPDTLEEEDGKQSIIILCCKDYCGVIEQIREMGEFDYRPLRCKENMAILDEYAVELQDDQEYLEKAQSILMKLMKEFDSVCRRHKLQYYVISGSLIGVVRHKGLIPWDDDIDVAMPRRDYDILRERAVEIWKDSDFVFADYDGIGDGVFLDFMARLVYKKQEIKTGIFRKAKGKVREDIQNRMVLDIYVLDNASNKAKKHKFHTVMIKAVYALCMGHRTYIDYAEYDRVSKFSRVFLHIVNKIGKMIPLKFLFHLYEKLRTYASKEVSNFYFESNGVINYMPLMYDKSLYGEGRILPMFGYDVNVPVDYDGLLKAKGYGDYMAFPPVNKRKPSHSVKSGGVIW